MSWLILNNWLPLPACVPCLKVATTAESSRQPNVLCCADRHPPPSTRALAAAQRAGLRQDSSPLFCRIVVQASVLVLRLMLFWGYPTSELKQFRFFVFFFLIYLKVCSHNPFWCWSEQRCCCAPRGPTARAGSAGTVGDQADSEQGVPSDLSLEKV